MLPASASPGHASSPISPIELLPDDDDPMIPAPGESSRENFEENALGWEGDVKVDSPNPNSP